MAVDQATKKLYNERIGQQKLQIAEYEKELAAYKKAMTQQQEAEAVFSPWQHQPAAADRESANGNERNL
jgi:hypothetical protein